MPSGQGLMAHNQERVNMNPYTGHLVAITEDQKVPNGYHTLPEELSRAAAMKLNGRADAYVSLKSGGKLSDWAKKKRKAKIAQKSKRKNRA